MSTRRGWIHRVTLSLVACVLAVAPAGPACGQDLAPATADPVARLLTRWGDDPAMGEAQLRAELVAQGVEALDEMLEVLARGRYPAPARDGRTATYTLDPRQRAALRSAVLDLPRGDVRGRLQELAGDSTPDRTRSAALELGAEWAGPDDAALLFALAGASRGAGPLPRTLRRALEASLGRLVEREPAATAQLRRLSRDLSLEPLLCVLHVLGRYGTEEDLEHLALIAGEDPRAASVALEEIGRLATRYPAPFGDRATRVLRDRLLTSSGPALLQAIEVVGRLEDVQAAPWLLRLLEHPHPAVRKQSRRALVAVCREPLPVDTATWQRWYQQETSWWNDVAPDRKADLRSGETERVARAIHDLAAHELFRHDTAAWIGEHLQLARPGLATLGCAALGHLRSGTAIPHLRAALERPEPVVRAAVADALQRIEGPHPAPQPISTF